jgi:methionine-rich copper-binding protein CopC
VIRSTWPALTAALLLGLAGALWPAGPAAAHAIVLESSPVHDAVLARSPEQVTLRFNSKLEKRFTRITLAAGSQPPAPVILPDGGGAAGPDRVVIPLAPLAPGVYVLRYRVLAVDGHITEGALRFTVGPAAQ